MTTTWMVRAETGGRLYDQFKEKGAVAIGWGAIGPLDDQHSREIIADLVKREWPEWKPQAIAMSAGQLYRFRSEMKVGDRVVTYNSGRRVYLLGTIEGEYRFEPIVDPADPHLRPVKWDGEVPRDLLSAATKNSLGSLTTIFLVPPEAADDLERALRQQSPAVEAVEEAPEEEDIFKDIQARAVEFIKDRVSRLDWEQMQQLVAGVLRGMGYKTRISPTGPDRGKDIVASPDGFGFQPPRIVVEVKHRSSAMGSQEVRSFLGGRHSQDKGLYVSTGGFTKEAFYEAERASIPHTLMDLDELVETLLEHYDKLDAETRQLIPLKRLYWPA